MGIVSIQPCKTYELQAVKAALENSIASIGGLDKHIRPNSRVLLKVNLLMKKRPEEATTTHPVFVEALADILVAHGCEVLIGDSPGGPFNQKSLTPIYETCGYNALVKPHVQLNWNFNERERVFDSGSHLKRMQVVAMLDDVDYVVSVSKLKTHGMMLFTGAVKNMFGVIPGLIKAEYHFKMPNTDDFADALVDICEGVKPVLSFMDGIVGMEGAGPSAGEPVDIGVVIAAENPHELDYAAVHIVNIPPLAVPTLKAAHRRGLIQDRMDSIQFIGFKPEEVRIAKFETPEIRSVAFLDERYPKWMRHLADKLLKPKPIFIKDKCVGCGECARLCPPQTIEMIDRFPVVHLENCIRCYCCQELCPKKAVEIERPWLLKFITKL